MTYSLIIKQEASDEIAEAFLYYEHAQKGLGEKFLLQLDKYFELISNNPNHFEVKRPPYREAYIRKFPYLIIFEVADRQIIVYSVFAAVLNPSKKPG